MIEIKLTKEHKEQILDLFCKCFQNDHYYTRLFPNSDTRSVLMRETFNSCISYCIDQGCSIGIMDDNQRIIAFALCFDYMKVKREDPQMFYYLFGASSGESLPFKESIHIPIEHLSGKIIYLLSIAVDLPFRRMGLASGLIDSLLTNNMDCNIVSDVSNESSVSIYKSRNFTVDAIDENYYLVVHKASTLDSVFRSDKTIKLLIPNTKLLEDYSIDYKIIKQKQYLIGYEIANQFDISVFLTANNIVCCGTLIELSYENLLKYQRILNVSHYSEHECGDFIFYVQIFDYYEKPYMNETLSHMLANREKEWSIIPDTYISIPVQYTDLSLLQEALVDSRAQKFLDYMNFRTNYEAGVPSTLDRVDDLASLKKRIKRIYLGKIRILISTELSPNTSEKIESIGPSALMDMYISIDRYSDCAVLTLISLSTPFLISHLLDNMIRNQLCVENLNTKLFDFLKLHYGIIKRGTAKAFLVVPTNSDSFLPDQIASLLCSETIYPEGENFGRINDPEILTIVNKPYGMGQYDRAMVFAYTNVVLQFSKEFVGTLDDRICEESITLFYIELILFEEAAIHIADQEIVNLFTNKKNIEPIDFLKHVDTIYDNFSKTIDFWNVKVNYPTSQKSIKMLRAAFSIDEMLENVKRNQDHLKTVFDTKCDIIDRKSSKRMDTSLAILSILAIFSALIDGYDYIATWKDLFSGNVIYVLQKILFVLIVITAIYVVIHLFGKKINHKKLHKKKEDKNKTKH